MTDRLELLTATHAHEAALKDWWQILGRIKARFRTGDFATGLSLVNKIGEAVEAANHHPDVLLTWADVIVTLSSHDVRGIARRNVDLARRISCLAADLGIDADVSGLTQLELGLDTSLGPQIAPFYAALLGGRVDQGEAIDPSRRTPTVWWQDRGQIDAEFGLPERPIEQRWHFDVWVPHDEAGRRLPGYTICRTAHPTRDVDGRSSASEELPCADAAPCSPPPRRWLPAQPYPAACPAPRSPTAGLWARQSPPAR